MRRLFWTLSTALVALLALASPALAYNDGRGFFGPLSDPQITDAGFIIIAFFALFVMLASLTQWLLERRKAARKAARKALHAERYWRGGW